MRFAIALVAVVAAQGVPAQSWFEQHSENEWRREQAYQMGEMQREQRFAADAAQRAEYWSQHEQRISRIQAGVDAFQNQLREQDQHREHMHQLQSIQNDLGFRAPQSYLDFQSPQTNYGESLYDW